MSSFFMMIPFIQFFIKSETGEGLMNGSKYTGVKCKMVQNKLATKNWRGNFIRLIYHFSISNSVYHKPKGESQNRLPSFHEYTSSAKLPPTMLSSKSHIIFEAAYFYVNNALAFVPVSFKSSESKKSRTRPPLTSDWCQRPRERSVSAI